MITSSHAVIDKQVFPGNSTVAINLLNDLPSEDSSSSSIVEVCHGRAIDPSRESTEESTALSKGKGAMHAQGIG